ncbi:MAG: hypothetical protein U0V48_00195 [Anaerolineales bacterium]
MRSLLDTCFSWLVPIIEDMAVRWKSSSAMESWMFGAPVAYENDAERALRAYRLK